MIAFLRHLVTHDLGLKLVALALAVLIWATVQFATLTGPQVTRVMRDVPVFMVAADADVRALRPDPASVEVTVRGERVFVERLTAERLRVTADLTGITAVRGLRQPVDVAMPPSVTLVRVTPPEVVVVVPPQ